jgi:hypothetical protein
MLEACQTDPSLPSITSRAKTITMTGVIGVDPYAVLGTLVEGAVQTIVQQVPPERQAETAATLVHLLKERLAACGSPEARMAMDSPHGDGPTVQATQWRAPPKFADKLSIGLPLRRSTT